MKKILTYLLLLYMLVGCSSSGTTVLGIEQYLKWFNSAESHLVKTKYVNGMEIRLKYLPPEYLTYRDISNDPSLDEKHRDSLLNLYKNSLNFSLSLGPDERKGKGPDIMRWGVNDYKEYSARVKEMNFHMERYVKITADGREYRPVLSAMENVYGLSAKKNIILAFVPMEIGDTRLQCSEKLVFIYEDELFALGVNHFVFNRIDLDNCPQLKY